MVDVASSAPQPVSGEDFRTEESNRLKLWLEADHGSVALLCGRRGVGKARLAESLVRHAGTLPNVAIFEGQTPAAGGRSFHPFAEIAHQALSWAEQAGAIDALVDELYADLASVLENTAAEEEGAPSLDQKHHFFEGFRRLLSGIAERARLLVIVRDIEHADNDTLELAAYLADELFADPVLEPNNPSPGLLLMVMRTGLSAPAIDDFKNEMTLRKSVGVVALEGLDLDGLSRYVQSPHLLAKLLAASDGLPQEIDALIDAMPSNVEELFQRKLESLDATARESLRSLAISGRAASPRVLANVSGRSMKEVAHALNHLRDARIVERRIHQGEFQFTFTRRSDLEVTDRSLSNEARARLHSGWAKALTKLPDSGPALLAHHQLRSQEPRRGVPLAVQSAETYAVAGAFDAAVQMLEDARPHAAGELLQSVLHRLAELSPMTGSPRRALRYVEEWKASLPDHHQGPAFRREAELNNNLGHHDRALEALSSARQNTDEDALVERAEIEGTASEAYYHLGDLERGEQCGRAGLAFLEAAEGEVSTRARLSLLNQLGKIALAADDLDGAIDLFQETLERAEEEALEREQARALVNLGLTYTRRGNSSKAEASLIAGIEKAQAASDLTRLAFGHLNLGVVLHQRGELGRAIECYRECKLLFRRLGNQTQLARVLHNLGNLYLDCGDPDRAHAYNDEALRLAKQSGVGRLVAISTSLDGLIAGEKGDSETAESRLREAMVLQRSLGTERPLEAMINLAQLQLHFGQVDRAESTLDEVGQPLAMLESPLLDARSRLLRGQIMHARGNPEAISVLNEAKERFEGVGRRLFIRDTELAIGRCLKSVGQLETARMHFGAAQKIQEAVAEELPEDLRRVFLKASAQAAVHEALATLEGTPAVPVLQKRQAPVPPPAPSVRPQKVLDEQPEWKTKYSSIVGTSSKLHRVFHIIDRVAGSDSTVLIQGESGTGKELVAEAIHRNSPRAKGPFVKLNCAALVETLLLSELFGHERGSFTGAHQRKIGRFEMAAGGTIFLDEIGDISPKTQVALLRVLQEREFERVGGGKPIKVQARILVATNRNLAQMVKNGTFREDLYYRLKALTIELPPLRDRPDDILLLSEHFLAQYAAESATVEKSLSASGISLLKSYAWPGNVRELENIIRSVALFAESNVIDGVDFDEYRELFQDGPDLVTEEPQPVQPVEQSPPPPTPSPPPVVSTEPVDTEAATKQAIDVELLSQIFEQGVPLPELKKQIQSQAIARALRMTKGNITRAAEVLGMRRPRLSQIINASDELKALCQGVSR